jgi:hypothetical protein
MEMRTVIRTTCVRQTNIILFKCQCDFKTPIHQSWSKNPKFVHGIEPNVTATKEYPNEKPSQFARREGISAKTPKGDKKAAVQNRYDDKKFEKIFYLEHVTTTAIVKFTSSFSAEFISMALIKVKVLGKSCP